MTTNYTSILNDNLDMLDNDESTMSVMETIECNAEFPMYFEIINADDFKGNKEGLANMWRYEYRRGEELYIGQTYTYYGYAEDNAFQFNDIEYILWPMNLHGWELTGRVWFHGYAEEHIAYNEGHYEEVFDEVEVFPSPQ